MPASWKRLLTTDDIVTENLGNTNLTADASRTYTLSTSSNLKFISDNGTELIKLTSGPIGAGTDLIDITSPEINLRHSVGTASPALKFYESGDDAGDNYVGLKSPSSMSASFTLTLPTADGTNGQVLQTDGSGTLSFADAGGGTIDGTGAANKIAIWSDADTLTNDTDLSWYSSTNTLRSVNYTASGSVTCDILVADEINVQKQPATNAAGAYDGAGSRVFNKVGASSSPTNPQGKVFALTGSGAGSWAVADKDAEATSIGLLAVWPNTGGPSKMLAEGTVLMASNSGWSTASAGAPLYLADDGAVKASAPGDSGDIVRIVGYVLNAASRIMYFRPDPTFIKIA